MYVAIVALWLRLLQAKQEKCMSGTAMLRNALALVVWTAMFGQSMVRGAAKQDVDMIKGFRSKT